MFKKLFMESRDDMSLAIELAKEIKKKYKLKKLPIRLEDDFEPDESYKKDSKNGKMKVLVNTKDYSSPVYDYEYI